MMVPKSLGVKSAVELDGANICTNTGTTTELNITDYFRSNNMKFNLVAFEKADEVVAAYDSGRCDVYTTDRSGLAAQRTKLTKPDDHMVLPEIISKEPLGPVVKYGDQKWSDIIRWTVYVLFIAEEMGINSKNIDSFKNHIDPNIQRFMGEKNGEDHPHLGAKLGLKATWSYDIIKQVGNYKEIYERNVGPDTPIGLQRGLNRLYNNGGLLYAPPLK
jgi:general L-amino acid transport system substrate-binding protein